MNVLVKKLIKNLSLVSALPWKKYNNIDNQIIFSFPFLQNIQLHHNFFQSLSPNNNVSINVLFS